MKPYYDHAGIQIFHGDCREVLPWLNGMVVTDPPYNIGYKYEESYKDNLSQEEYKDLIGMTLRPPSVVIHYPEDMFVVSGALCEIPEEVVAWVYNAHTPRKWRSIAWFGCKPDFSLLRQPYKNLFDKRILIKLEMGIEGCALYDWWHEEQVKNVSEEKTEHPCQVPLEVMLKILQITPCDQVVDPFCGSGTTLLAAKQVGRRAIGIEIEEKYCEIAAKRLSQEVLEFEQPSIGR